MGRRKKIKYDKVSTKATLSDTDTPAALRKEFPDALVAAYVDVVNSGFDDDKLYKKFKKLAVDFLGKKANDAIEDGKLVVRLTKATFDLVDRKQNKCKKHKNYKALRKPRAGCEDCWTMYNEKTKKEASKEESKLARSERTLSKSGPDEGQEEGKEQETV